jgi:Zn finger protein HypA/HybF involved in hydrogenase expression
MEKLCQCGSCEQVFDNPTLENDCPNCFSGNWVVGYIDEE